MYKEILEKVQKEFTINQKLHPRYYHTIGVIEMALTLNYHHQLNLDPAKVFIASAFHDIAKLLDKESMLTILQQNFLEEANELKDYPAVWHSFVGAVYAKEKYQINDEEILNAIKYHTTGRPNMTDLEKIVFISDYIEKNTRTEASMIEARKLAYNNLDEAVKKILIDTIAYLEKNEKSIYRLTKDTLEFYK